jgi:hypothetical protein
LPIPSEVVDALIEEQGELELERPGHDRLSFSMPKCRLSVWWDYRFLTDAFQKTPPTETEPPPPTTTT